MLCDQCGSEKKLLFTSWYCERCEGKDTNHTYEWNNHTYEWNYVIPTASNSIHTCDFSMSFTCSICGIDIGEFWKSLGPGITSYSNWGLKNIYTITKVDTPRNWLTVTSALFQHSNPSVPPKWFRIKE